MRRSVAVLSSLLLAFGCSSGDGDSGIVGGTTSAGGNSGGAGQGGAASSGSATGGSGGFDLTSSSGVAAGGAGGQEMCIETLTLRVRDFSQSHPDFQWGAHPNFGQITGVRTGILANDLAQQQDGSFKPVYAAGANVSPNGPNFAPFTGQQNFDAWFRDTPGVNHAVNVELPLDKVGNSLVYDNADFHPVDANFGFGDEGFSINGSPNNWHFTTEALVSFRYEGGEVFTFRGDDDIWIFINRKLAIDLGGLHGPIEGTVNLDERAAELGLVIGETYQLQVFQAERNYSGSNYRFETSDFCLVPIEPPK